MSGMTAEQRSFRAPFPWYGGKRRVADHVWALLGSPSRYVEPFAGSLGVLLGRPGGAPSSGLEVINDLDGFVVNVWRAIRAEPEATARYAIGPVTELDTTARHLWLVNEGRAHLRALAADPEWCDPKIAGWWLYGIAAWIGTGWCSGVGPWTRSALLAGEYRKLPHLGDDGRGVNRKLPHLGDDGQGVNRQLPHLGDDGQGARIAAWTAYLERLATRLHRVLICNGDWQRLLTPIALAERSNTVGVYLDPPYRQHGSEYGVGDSGVEDLWQRLQEWCNANGDNPKLRIVLSGYDGDFAMPHSWREISYTGRGTTTANATRERFWVSPACLGQQSLLGEASA